MPGTAISRRPSSVARASAKTCRSFSRIWSFTSFSCATSICKQRRASAGICALVSSSMMASNRTTPPRPTGATIPNSAMCARVALVTMTSCRLSMSRTLCSIIAL
jgi:hypothetical protein